MAHFPSHLKYSKEDEWYQQEGNIITCGITDYAQDQLSDVVFVELPEVGRVIKAKDSVAVLESVKSVSDLYFPAEGEIMAVNEELTDQPELVNQDPYEKGWVVKIKVEDTSFLDDLMDSKAYESQLEEE
ncbi:glycine cleavage system protein GcvH [Spirochaeta cellobiosiphila]|uniref:glycine cleavage system protein GcvH n=1 Tax=Spirochaeta cellobiosiphila TaxID=504483 RepID=UPI0003F96A3C|nr:glycine cleavage system protein GcvH [Spirochaeta cellobiosiphila]